MQQCQHLYRTMGMTTERHTVTRMAGSTALTMLRAVAERVQYHPL